MSTDALRRFVARLTDAPGVYRMIGVDGELLYVGKARNLRKRVGSYFNKAHNERISAMVAQIDHIEVTTTRTEGEALLLEDQLIKSGKPRYNVMLRDDKSYPQIFVASKDPFPRLAFHRGPQREAGAYFGPYPSAHAVRSTLDILQKLFRIRQCEDSFFANRTRPCLQYQIKRCTAPCVDLIDKAQYQRDVQHALMFLKGRSDEVINALAGEMTEASDRLEFERAAEIRDRIAAVNKIAAKQFVTGARNDMDIIACEQGEGVFNIQVVFFRGGRNLGNRSYFPQVPPDMAPAEVLEGFISRFYSRHQPPKEILTHITFEEKAMLESALAANAGYRVRVVTRPRGERAGWVQAARSNAQTAIVARAGSRATVRTRLKALGEMLGLARTPERVECFDISHTMGEATVASCVVFGQEGPEKSAYRRFNISGIEPGDDYAAMEQAVRRRYQRVVSGEVQCPDVVLIDGGKGQLAKALAAIDALGLSTAMTVAAVAKGPERRAGQELLIDATRPDGQRLGQDLPASLLVQQIRDEAHRFAITGHRGQRGKARTRSSLEDVPGIGPRKRAELLKRFGGLQGVRQAGVEELTAVKGINLALAQRIYDALH